MTKCGSGSLLFCIIIFFVFPGVATAQAVEKMDTEKMNRGMDQYWTMPVAPSFDHEILLLGDKVLGGSFTIDRPNCSYQAFPSRIHIISIEKPWRVDSWIVNFRVQFVPDNEIGRIEREEFSLLIPNMTDPKELVSHYHNPDSRFLEKFGIRVGKIFPCVLFFADKNKKACKMPLIVGLPFSAEE